MTTRRRPGRHRTSLGANRVGTVTVNNQEACSMEQQPATRGRGRPRIHKDKQAAQAAASAAYRARRQVRLIAAAG